MNANNIETKQEIIIPLWNNTNPYLIIKCPSGIKYSFMAGGKIPETQTIEGVLFPILSMMADEYSTVENVKNYPKCENESKKVLYELLYKKLKHFIHKFDVKNFNDKEAITKTKVETKTPTSLCYKLNEISNKHLSEHQFKMHHEQFSIESLDSVKEYLFIMNMNLYSRLYSIINYTFNPITIGYIAYIDPDEIQMHSCIHLKFMKIPEIIPTCPSFSKLNLSEFDAVLTYPHDLNLDQLYKLYDDDDDSEEEDEDDD